MSRQIIDLTGNPINYQKLVIKTITNMVSFDYVTKSIKVEPNTSLYEITPEIAILCREVLSIIKHDVPSLKAWKTVQLDDKYYDSMIKDICQIFDELKILYTLRDVETSVITN